MTSFPITAHAAGRYLVDASGNPFFIIGDSAQQLPSKVSLANAGTYLDTRVGQGFNTTLIELVSIRSRDATMPRNVNGDLPFTLKSGGGAYAGVAGTADFSSTNDAFFANVRAIVDLCATKGVQVLMYPLAWGFGGPGTNQGWWDDLSNATNTTAVCTAFGAYLANGHGTFSGFKTCTNLWWLHGSDYGESSSNTSGLSTNELRARAMLFALLSNGATQLASGDWNAPSLSTDESQWTAWMQLNGVYSYGDVFPNASPNNDKTYQQSRLGYNFVPTVVTQSPSGLVVPPAIPTYGKEFVYQPSPFDPPGNPPQLRRAQNWAWLSGCTTGIFYGDENVWPFDNGTYQTALTDVSALDFARFSTFVRGLRWWTLVPSELAGMRRLVTSANGTQTGAPATYVAAACASDGYLLVGYFPSGGSGAQTATVDLRSMAGNSRARWWDPTNGTFTNITGGAFSLANTLSAQSFTTPGNNSAGDADWFLVLDAQIPATLLPWAPSPNVTFARR